MSLIRRRKKSIAGLESTLAKAVQKDQISSNLDDILSGGVDNKVSSTSAIQALYEKVIQNIKDNKVVLTDIIDDAAETGGEITWSIDQIKSFVASVNDSIVVSNLAERDEIENPASTLIAFVLDTAGDESLGKSEGNPASYIYVEGDGWKLMQVLKGDIDLTPYVKKDSIVNNITEGGAGVPLSAEQGVVLAAMIAEGIKLASVEMVVDALVVDGNYITLTYEARGAIVNNTIEIEVDDGIWDIVDIEKDADNAKKYKILSDNDSEYDGKNCKASYIKQK